MDVGSVPKRREREGDRMYGVSWKGFLLRGPDFPKSTKTLKHQNQSSKSPTMASFLQHS
ncbi:hypothetical protein EDC38_1741 [Marinimicrobium koreense]|uniref:Uncharacterized protein n=1 Tax=Marinimicrobium koreense TaxID=306545 RepID=A0A3N1NZ70_9GAMM|nr:hypothetical protein EDC38_1741 [Marinimicrobium koreense]